MQETASREKLEEEERLDREKNGESAPASAPHAAPQGGVQVSEIDRTVKARWSREGSGADIDKDRLIKLFEAFGPVENAFLLKDKKQKTGHGKSKTVVATGVVVFTSVVGAHAAVQDFKKQAEPDFRLLESVFWAANKEPEFIRNSSPISPAVDDKQSPPTPLSAKSRPSHELPGMDKPPSTPSRNANGNGLRKAPSFASFSPAGLKTPQSSPFANSATQSPSLEELTMIRLKNAEKKRLEEQIRRDEAEGANQD